ncbi:MAG: hypothetical protein QXT77_07645 [Candidatus Methanomethylicaceae archaeon]
MSTKESVRKLCPLKEDLCGVMTVAEAGVWEAIEAKLRAVVRERARKEPQAVTVDGQLVKTNCRERPGTRL